mgnify:CR=1 FL=1
MYYIVFELLHAILELIPVSSTLFIELLGIPMNMILTWHMRCGLALFIVLLYNYNILDIINIKKYSTNRLIFYITTYVFLFLLLIGFKPLIIYSSLLNIRYIKYITNIIFGILLFIATKYIENKKFNYSMTSGMHLGTLQFITLLIPGISRLGMILTYLFFHGISIKESLTIGWIMSIPISLMSGISYNLISNNGFNFINILSYIWNEFTSIKVFLYVLLYFILTHLLVSNNVRVISSIIIFRLWFIFICLISLLF